MADDQRKQDVGAPITDEGIERMRARIGVEVPKEQPWNEYATVDAIRHFAWWRSMVSPRVFFRSLRTRCVMVSPYSPCRRPMST